MSASITDRIYGQSPGVAIKAPVLAVGLANVVLSGLSPVSGYQPNEGDRILLVGQTDPTTNGIYNASASAWQRSGDMQGPYDIVNGTLVVASPGTPGTPLYQLVTPNPSIGSTPLAFQAWMPQGNLLSQTFQGNLAEPTGANIYLHRLAAYNGGPSVPLPWVNSVVRFQTDVSPGANNDEWTITSIMNNSSTGVGENVAIYGKGNKLVGNASPTWAGVMEVNEFIATNDPTTGTVGLEVDNGSNGTDAHFNRVGIDVVARRYDPNGAPTVVSWGVRVQANDDPNVTIVNGFAVWDANVGIAFDCGNATVLSGAMRMPQGAAILFDTTNTPQRLLSQGLGLDHFGTGGTLVNRLLNAGGLQVGNAQVVGARINGYGAPTGGSHQASFAAGSITLPNLAAWAAQLTLDLQTHGLIGA